MGAERLARWCSCHQRWRGRRAWAGAVWSAGAEAGAADRRGGLRRERGLDRCGVSFLRHHHHHTRSPPGGPGWRHIDTGTCGDAETIAPWLDTRYQNPPGSPRAAGWHHTSTALPAGGVRKSSSRRVSRINSASHVPVHHLAGGFWLPQPGPGGARCRRIQGILAFGRSAAEPCRSARSTQAITVLHRHFQRLRMRLAHEAGPCKAPVAPVAASCRCRRDRARPQPGGRRRDRRTSYRASRCWCQSAGEVSDDGDCTPNAVPSRMTRCMAFCTM